MNYFALPSKLQASSVALGEKNSVILIDLCELKL
jgi:hypothetical protein